MFHENTLPDGMKDADKTNRAKPSRLESRGPKRKRQLKILFVVGMFVPGGYAVEESQVDLLVRQESGEFSLVRILRWLRHSIYNCSN